MSFEIDKDKPIKAIIAILLLLCLLKMPYGYYQLMRIAVTALFSWLAYNEWSKNRKLLAFVCAIMVILFQPFQKLAFHKQEWQLIDVCVAIALIIWIVIDTILFVRRKNRD
jgi:hypothetical protein